ncbi:SDR family NAD(P)-dependent oxidoreductase [Streptomyces sp. MBT65]|nr:SDR family NAD(P)-dependent oxidoreductase [Streptomyces sp. MBT65]
MPPLSTSHRRNTRWSRHLPFCAAAVDGCISARSFRICPLEPDRSSDLADGTEPDAVSPGTRGRRVHPLPPPPVGARASRRPTDLTRRCPAGCIRRTADRRSRHVAPGRQWIWEARYGPTGSRGPHPRCHRRGRSNAGRPAAYAGRPYCTCRPRQRRPSRCLGVLRRRPARSFDSWDLEACANTVGCALAEWGGLDGVVVRTGVAAFGAAGEVDDAAAEHVTVVNALSPMLLLRAASDQVSEGGILAVVTGAVAVTAPARMGDCVAAQATWASWLTALRPVRSRRRVAVPEISLAYVNTGLAPRAAVARGTSCRGGCGVMSSGRE